MQVKLQQITEGVIYLLKKNSTRRFVRYIGRISSGERKNTMHNVFKNQEVKKTQTNKHKVRGEHT